MTKFSAIRQNGFEAETCSSIEREVRSINLGPVKLDRVLTTARHRCDVSSKGAVLPANGPRKLVTPFDITLQV